MRSLIDFDNDALQYVEGFVDQAEADELLDRLGGELRWRQEKILLFGRRVKQPRLTAWYGDPEARYQYSGLSLEPMPWHPLLARLRHRLELALHHRFNSVLANAYRHGRDSMGWHCDDEPELGAQPLIASLSLGAERRFLLRRKGARQSSGMVLSHGSLLVMKGECQETFQHCVPKTAKPTGLRINLTFRLIRTQPPPP
jgi:alkylated DNA repair dioxygenase AlkB